MDGQPYAWHDGDDVVIDETYIHSAYNRTDQDRLIVFCPVWISSRVRATSPAQPRCSKSSTAW